MKKLLTILFLFSALPTYAAVDFLRPQTGDLVNVPILINGNVLLIATSSVISSSSIPSLNVGTLTATTGTSYINILTLGTALADAYIASASTWNSKESALTFSSPLSRSVNTISCSTCATFAFPWTPTSVWGSTISGTSSSIFTTNGFYASSSSRFSSTTVIGALNVGTLTATSGTSYLNALSLGTALPDAQIASAATWNAKADTGSAMTGTFDGNNFAGGAIGTGEIIYGGSAGSFSELAVGTAGQVIMMSNGLPVWASTSSASAFAYPFTPTIFNGLTTSGTTSAISSTLGFYASSTSILASTTILGSLNIGTLTATSGTSYINALNLGTALADANISSAATWNAKESALTFNSPLIRTVNTITCPGCNYPFTGAVYNGLNTSGTSTAISTTLGFYASSTSILSSTTVLGSFNAGTITATSGTSYLNALSLGTKLPNTELANSSLTIAAGAGIGLSGCAPVALGGTCTISNTGASFAYPFTPTIFNGLTTSGTTSAISSTLGFYASGTSIFASTSVLGSFNTGTITATSGTSWLNALNVGGKVGIGTTTPWGALSVLSNTNPMFAIATSSAAVPLLYVGATSTPYDAGMGDGVRVVIGTSTQPDGSLNGINANLYVDGRIDQSYAFQYDSFISGFASTTVDTTIDGWLNFDVGTAASCTVAPLSNQQNLRGGVLVISTALAAVGSQCHLDTGNVLETAQGTSGAFTASGTPMMEIMMRFKDLITTESAVIGFGDIPQNTLVTTSTIQSCICFMFDPGVSANWLLVKKHSIVDSGAGTVNSTTTTGIAVSANVWYKLTLAYSSTTIQAWINDTAIPVTLNGSIPSRNHDFELFFRSGGAVGRAMYVQYIKLWTKPDNMP